MKKVLTIFMALFVMVNFANCDLLADLTGVKLLTDESDFSAEPPTDNSTFIIGFEFTNDDVINTLLGTDGADFEIPGLEEAFEATGESVSGNMIMAKQVKYGTTNKWQLAALMQLKGDKLVYKKQTGFPVAKDSGKYALWVSDVGVGFVNGKAVNCSGEEQANMWAISGDNNYLTKTNGSGRWALPVETGDTGKSVTVIFKDDDCGGSSSTSVPISAPGDDAETENPKAEETTDSGEAGQDATMEGCNGDPDAQNTSAPEAPQMRQEGDTPRSSLVPTDMTVVSYNNSGTPTEQTPGALNPTANSTGDELVISTGGSGVKGVAAFVELSDLDSKSTITVEYSVLSQEFPVYATGAFNDALGIGFAGAQSPSWANSVGNIQLEASGEVFNWAINSPLYTSGSGSYGGKSFDYEDNTRAQYVVDIANSADATSSHGGKNFGGRMKKSASDNSDYSTATFDIPANIKRDGAGTLIIAVGDVGDSAFDTAVAIKSITIE